MIAVERHQTDSVKSVCCRVEPRCEDSQELSVEFSESWIIARQDTIPRSQAALSYLIPHRYGLGVSLDCNSSFLIPHVRLKLCLAA